MPSINLLLSALLLVLLAASGYLIQYNRAGIDALGIKIEEVRFSYLSSDKFWGENVFRQNYGSVVCEGNTITSVSSRVFTNFLDLEIYCRDTAKTIALKQTVLPKPSTSLVSSSIQNYEGELYSVTSGEVFDFKSGHWTASDASTKGLYLLQPYQKSWARIKWKGPDCNGLTIRILDSEYCAESKNVSAILVWNEKVYVNDTGKLVVYEIPKPNGIHSGRVKLSPAQQYDGEDWSYFIVPFRSNEEVIWGGSSEGYGTSPTTCPEINRSNDHEEPLVPLDCFPRQIKEWYAVTKIGADYLFGSFPDGSIGVVGEFQNTVRLGNLGKHDASDFQDRRFKTHYRESQSITHSYGYVWIGMFPWGELIRSDLLGNSEQVTLRLFSSPNRTNSPAPYFESFLTSFSEEYTRKTTHEYIYSFVDASGQSLRAKGIEPTILGQRIPSIAVLDGRICASTGNLNELRPHPRVLSKATVSNIDEYGKVHCLELPNQLLIQNIDRSDFRVDVHQRGIKVFLGGYLIKVLKFRNLEIS